MKTTGKLSKIVSVGKTYVLHFALLLFACLALLWGATALPTHAAAAACALPSSRASLTIKNRHRSGSTGTKVTVSGSHIEDTGSADTTCPLLTSGTVSFGISTNGCSSLTAVTASATPTWYAPGAFRTSFNWPSSPAGIYTVCATITASDGSSQTLASSKTFRVTGDPTTGGASITTGGASITSSPASGLAGTAISVTGSNIPVTSGSTTSVVYGYATDSACNTFVAVTSPTTETVTNGAFTGSFAWPSGTTMGTTYYVCAQVNGVTGTLVGNTFQVTAADPQWQPNSAPSQQTCASRFSRRKQGCAASGRHHGHWRSWSDHERGWPF